MTMAMNEIASATPLAVPPALLELMKTTTAKVRITPRQKEVLSLLCLGASNKRIACHLGVTEATIKHHVMDLMIRSQTHNRTQLVVFALSGQAFDVYEEVEDAGVTSPVPPGNNVQQGETR